MNINNFNQIRSLLNFENSGDFYFIQILKRRKENPDMERHVNVIKSLYIKSLEEYDELIPLMTELCEKENARAYIRMNKRNTKHLGLSLFKKMVSDLTMDDIEFGFQKKRIEIDTVLMYYIINDNINIDKMVDDFGYKLVESVCGSNHSDTDKKWIIDIDTKDKEVIESIKSCVYKLQLETKKEPMMVEVETKNGIHLITRPFNVSEFKKEFPDVDYHKDNMTILYY